MRYFTKIRQFAALALMLGLNLALSACGSLSSPLDQAIYTGGDDFSLKGYSRTIFSSSNF